MEEAAHAVGRDPKEAIVIGDGHRHGPRGRERRRRADDPDAHRRDDRRRARGAAVGRPPFEVAADADGARSGAGGARLRLSRAPRLRARASTPADSAPRVAPPARRRPRAVDQREHRARPQPLEHRRGPRRASPRPPGRPTPSRGRGDERQRASSQASPRSWKRAADVAIAGLRGRPIALERGDAGPDAVDVGLDRPAAGAERRQAVEDVLRQRGIAREHGRVAGLRAGRTARSGRCRRRCWIQLAPPPSRSRPRAAPDGRSRSVAADRDVEVVELVEPRSMTSSSVGRARASPRKMRNSIARGLEAAGR